MRLYFNTGYLGKFMDSDEHFKHQGIPITDTSEEHSVVEREAVTSTDLQGSEDVKWLRRGRDDGSL